MKSVLFIFIYIGFSSFSFAHETPKILLALVTPTAWSTGVLGHAFVLKKETNQPLMFSRAYNYNKFYDPDDKKQVAANLTGQLPMELEIVPFFSLYKLYSTNENRSLVLIELNLTDEESSTLIGLLESDKNTKLPYSVKSNCLSRIIEHVNRSVQAYKRIPYDPEVGIGNFNFIKFIRDPDQVLSRFPMELLKILEKHPLNNGKQFMDSYSVQTVRVFLTLESKINQYTVKCQWHSSISHIINKSFYFSFVNPSQIREGLLPFVGLGRLKAVSWFPPKYSPAG